MLENLVNELVPSSSSRSTSLEASRGSASAVLGLLAAGALALSGCGQSAHATPADPLAHAPPVASVAAPGLAGASAAAPVPATFDVPALVERVKPLVVNITITAQRGRPELTDPFDFFFGGPRGARPDRTQKPSALGTGFLIDAEGHIVTNAHVVDKAEEVRVRLSDDREFRAEVVGRDPKLDIALLKLQGATGLPSAALGSSEQLRVGEHVLAVGNPFGLGHTVTLGIVSAKARSIGAGPYDDFIQTDASINPGNSGGPLFNWRGEVVGINTAIRAGASGIGFAIPVDALRDVLPQLRAKGFVERGKLGLVFQPLTAELATALGLPAPRGALVSEILPGGSAARAGIQAGDVIVSVNGTPIVHSEELPRNVARNAPGTTIQVGLVRNGKRQEVAARLDALEDENRVAPARSGAAPPSGAQRESRLGVHLSDAPGGGARVDDVTANDGRVELSRGDVIVAVNGAPVRDVATLRAAIARLKSGTTALLKVRRGEGQRFVAVPIP